MIETLKKITENPWLNLIAGAILLGTAGYEVWESLAEHTIGAHHGVALFGLLQLLRSIPEVMHGLEKIETGEEELEKKAPHHH